MKSILRLRVPQGPGRCDRGLDDSDLVPDRSDVGPEGSDLCPGRCDLGPEGSDLGSDCCDRGPDASELGPDRCDRGPDGSTGLWKRSRTDQRDEAMRVRSWFAEIFLNAAFLD